MDISKDSLVISSMAGAAALRSGGAGSGNSAGAEGAVEERVAFARSSGETVQENGLL